MGKIFSLNVNKAAPKAQLEFSISGDQSPSHAAENGGIIDSWVPDDQPAYEGLPQEFDDSFMLWNYPELSAWDSFLFLSDAFAVEGQESI